MLKNIWSKFSIGIFLVLLTCFLADCSTGLEDSKDYLQAGE